VLINEDVFDDFYINIPSIYLNKLVIEELKSNLSFYSDKNREIKVEIQKNSISKIKNEHVCVTIINYYSENVKEFSSSEGLNCLKLMSVSELFNFQYDYAVNRDDQSFTQKLIFTI